MEEEDDANKDSRYSYIETKPIYSSHVLTGNWFQARYVNIPQSSMAIVPCILDESVEQKGCERHVTTSQEAYSVEGIEPKEASRIYIESKLNKYSNFMSQRSSNKYLDAEKYKNNYMSLNHLVYELWPKILKEERELAIKQMSEQDAHKKTLHDRKLDSLDSFGSHSSIKRSICKESSSVDTHYKLHFTERYASPVKSAKMKDMIDRLT